ncbi:MAG TPA: AAA family ATPase [Terriglobia bacterium]|nr:AAA family ATPase [Terriglobia bacterium]
MTGGPGAGKTTLLVALQARGHTIVGDTARTIIQDRHKRGLSQRPAAHEFCAGSAAHRHRQLCSARCDFGHCLL